MKKILIYTCAILSVISMGIYAEVSHHTTRHHTAHHHVAQSTAHVDINKASETQLATLKGIGPAKAKAIVTYRQAHGDFKSVNDLSHVKGIGTKLIARIEAKNPGRMTVSTSE